MDEEFIQECEALLAAADEESAAADRRAQEIRRAAIIGSGLPIDRINELTAELDSIGGPPLPAGSGGIQIVPPNSQVQTGESGTHDAGQPKTA